MKISKLTGYLTVLLKDYLTPSYGHPTESLAFNFPILLRSEPGIGKTSILKHVINSVPEQEWFNEPEVQDYVAQFAADDGATWHAPEPLEPATMDPPDARGHLGLIKRDGAQVSQYSFPPIIEQPGVTARLGVRVADELGQSHDDMQKVLAPWFLEGRMGDYQSFHLRWAATNRVKDKSGVKRLLGHFRNRIKIIEVEPEAEALVAYCANLHFPELAYGFIQFKPGTIFADEVKSDDEPFCTPRSYVKGVQDLMLISGGQGQPLRTDDEATEHLKGWIGAGAASQFMSYLQVAGNVPTIEDILDDPRGCKVPSEPSMRYAVMGIVIHNVNDKNVGKLLTYVSRLPQEMQITIVYAFTKNARQGLFSSKEFGTWVNKNQDIIMAVQALGS